MQIGRKQEQSEVRQSAAAARAIKKATWNSEKKRNVVGVDDMTLLSTLSNEGISDNLQKRFNAGLIYTYIGNVLISVNPFRDLGIYTEEVLLSYVDRTLIEAPPHVFAVAESAIHRMRSYKENQCVIISGESGAGKTEAAKKIMQYIAAVCSDSSPRVNAGISPLEKSPASSAAAPALSHVRGMILATNPLLESFGNAKTLRNNNSSRFGKYIELQFNSSSQPVGAKISNYLLEKSRVVGQNDKERNFHIFYQICKSIASNSSHLAGLDLERPENFAYISKAGCLDADGIDDVQEFADVIASLQTIGITATEQKNIFSLLAGILWLGNISFSNTNEEDGDKVVVTNEQALQKAARLLAISADTLRSAFTHRSIIAPGSERIYSPLSAEQSAVVRDACAKVIYERLFDWIVMRVNEAMKPVDKVEFSIGILDIYGFEIFQHNSFEQLCINFVNEKLQQIFIELTLRAEQEDYVAEGITWTPIEFFDNKVVCDLIEGKRPPGIMAIMNDACARVHADSDKADIQFGQQLGNLSHARFSNSSGNFIIRHYAGDVTYTVSSMCEKNRDQTNKDLVEAFKTSQNAMIQQLFPEQVDWDNRQRPTPASEKMRLSAADLVTNLMACHPNYIRCIKPNEEKKAGKYDNTMGVHQVKYLGLLQNVKVRRAGFASREPMELFLSRYYLLSDRTCKAGECTWTGDVRQGCQIILEDSGIPAEQWQLGKCKVFIKSPETVFHLEEQREQYWDKIATLMQRAIRRYLKRVEEAAEVVQEFFRDSMGKNIYVQMREHASQLIAQRKERRTYSISSMRRYFGDYLDLAGSSGRHIRASAKIEKHELIVFSSRAKEPTFRMLRSTKLGPRQIVLTDSTFTVVANKLDKKTSIVEPLVVHKVKLSQISGVSLSTLADGFILVSCNGCEDILLTLHFKTELAAYILYQTKQALTVTDEFTVKNEAGKKTRSVTFTQVANHGPHEVVKGTKVTIGPGEPKTATTKPSVPMPRTGVIRVNEGRRAPGGASRAAFAPSTASAGVAAATKGVGKLNLAAIGQQKQSPPKFGAAGIANPSRPVPQVPKAPAPAFTHEVAYKIDGVEATELSAAAGAKLIVTSKGDNGWWLARDEGGKEGWVPSSFLKEI